MKPGATGWGEGLHTSFLCKWVPGESPRELQWEGRGPEQLLIVLQSLL